VGKGAYVDAGVTIGDRVKIQNGCQVYHGATVMDGAFLGPGVILTNDRYPRAIRPDGSLKRADDWIVGQIVIEQGASVGAGAIVVPPVTVGAFSIVGAGSVVTRDVPPHGLVAGNPARLVGFVCACGQRLKKGEADAEMVQAVCTGCGQVTPVPVSSWRLLK
jgi:acetyltransferase-like isoleucine patch superfamily enzyme